MIVPEFSAWQILGLVQHELLLFAAFFFVLGALDDLVIDLCWLWLRLTGRGAAGRADSGQMSARPLAGAAAILLPAGRRSAEIGETITHMLEAWPQPELRLYVGCFNDDAETIEAAMLAASGDQRIRLVVHASGGAEADCFNRLYQALRIDEARAGAEARMVVLHEVGDRVDPAALALLDRAITGADLVQLPVMPLPQPASRWIGSHYCEELAEANGKEIVVREALGAALPATGSGLALSRRMLGMLADSEPDGAPFRPGILAQTHDLGARIAELGGTTRFLRMRHADGALVATRIVLPARLGEVVRHKARTIHGIALAGWDRLGWSDPGQARRIVDTWMRLRDRRSPLAAIVLLSGYLCLALAMPGWLAGTSQTLLLFAPGAAFSLLLAVAGGLVLWRAAMRFAFAACEYGVGEACRAILRLPPANVIAIMAGFLALVSYARALRGLAGPATSRRRVGRSAPTELPAAAAAGMAR